MTLEGYSRPRAACAAKLLGSERDWRPTLRPCRWQEQHSNDPAIRFGSKLRPSPWLRAKAPSGDAILIKKAPPVVHHTTVTGSSSPAQNRIDASPGWNGQEREDSVAEWPSGD